MISSPATPYAALWQSAAKLVVLLGPTDGSKPVLGSPATDDEDAVVSNEVTWLIPQRISLSAGGGRDDVMTFVVDLGKLNQRLLDTTTPTGTKRQIEVRGLDDMGKPTIVYGWGFISKNPQRIGPDAETTMFEARIAKQHFGKPLTSYPVWLPVGQRLDVNRPLIFNPEIDEIIESNMSSQLDPAKGWAFVLDPESIRTAASKAYQVQTVAPWKLSDAVLAICWWLNPDEAYIKNPTKNDLTTALADRDTMLKNVTIPMGAFLPQALDTLLMPFEYGWHLQHGLDSAQSRFTTLRFFPRGKGTKKQVFMQRPGTIRDIKATNVADFEVDYDINALANRIETYGDYLKREKTFILKPGWSVTYDGTELHELEKGESFSEQHPSVGRKWILNEAGDYNGLRPEHTAYYSFDSLFGQPQIVKRRRFLRCLSQHLDADDLESNGFRVDWYDEDQEGATDPDNMADTGWVRVKWSFGVLEKECGIVFEGTTPPEALWGFFGDHPEKARVRITATVAGDQRVKGIATRRDKSPNGQDVTLVLDLHDRFQFGKVDDGSIFKDRSSTARDDSTVIQTYAEAVREIEDAMKVHSSIPLEGIAHPEYKIGDLIDQVSGRNLSLNGYSPSGGADTRNPQIVGFVYHLSGGQRMELLLDSFERERPSIVMDNHQRVLA